MQMKALRGNLSELSLFLILVLFLSYVTSEKSYDGTAKGISSILVVSKADVRSYPSCNSGIPRRRCKDVSMPLYQTAMSDIESCLCMQDICCYWRVMLVLIPVLVRGIEMAKCVQFVLKLFDKINLVYSVGYVKRTVILNALALISI